MLWVNFPLPCLDSQSLLCRSRALVEGFGMLSAAAADTLPTPSMIYLLGFHLLLTVIAFSFPLSLLQKSCQFEIDD